MRADLLLAIDQGSTSTRAVAYDLALKPVADAVRPVETRHPRAGWVEQDPGQIVASVVESVAEVLQAVGPGRIAAVGLDNQGETVVAWDAESGCALAPAISWQCRRSEAVVERLRAAGHGPAVRRRTGLPLDPYFSAGKMTWLLEEVPEVGRARQEGRLRLGTVDAWLTAQLGGQPLTDPSTASRTQLFDLHRLAWSEELLDLFGVPAQTLPRLVGSAGRLGILRHPMWDGAELPLTALACDQQAALAGHGAFEPGGIKATYGTGVFVLATTGSTPPQHGEQLLGTVAWQLADGTTTYALDGGVFTAGTLLGWLTDGLGVLDDAQASEALARSVPNDGGVLLLPALAGLGAPWWRPEARGVIAGISAATRRGHVVRAALDGIANRVADVVEAMIETTAQSPEALRVDGGLSKNAYLLERQADLLGLPVDVASAAESTALGIAGLAGIGAGLIGPEAITAANPVARRINPRSAANTREREREAWRAFLVRAAELTIVDGDRRDASPSKT